MTPGADAPGPGKALYVLDVDGTLLNSRHEVTAAVRDAVAVVRARGATVMLASSRAPRALLPVLQALGAPPAEIFVAAQGAVTARVGDLRYADRTGAALPTLHLHRAPLDAARELARRALDLGVAVNWFTGMSWYVSHVDDLVLREADVVRVRPERVASLLDLGVGPDKLMFMSEDRAVLEALTSAVPDGLRAQTSNATYVEVTAADVDKASAVRRHCAQAGIVADDVLAVGDGPNDVELLAWAGTAIAVGNARPEVHAVADRVVASNDDDGVAQALLAHP